MIIYYVNRVILKINKLILVRIFIYYIKTIKIEKNIY
jgi:hypothetical protein